MDINTSLAWNLYSELRKEILATQELRSRAIELKITIVGAAIGLFVANRDKIGDDRLLVLPALAAIFFDFLIGSYSFAIKRKGRYLREYLEPQLRREFSVPAEQSLWEEYLSKPEQRQMFSVIANLGLSVLAMLPAVFVLARDPSNPLHIALIALLVFLMFCIAAIYGHLDYFSVLRIWRRRKPPVEPAPLEPVPPITKAPTQTALE